MHIIIPSCTSHLENTHSLNYGDLPNIDAFIMYIASKILLINITTKLIRKVLKIGNMHGGRYKFSKTLIFHLEAPTLSLATNVVSSSP